MSSTKRQHPRVAANISVRIKTSAGQMSTTERITNVSLGGVFIEMEEPLAFGTELELEFTLPQGQRQLRCRGLVVWSTKTSPEKAVGKHGVGVRLMEIGISDMRQLSEFIESKL